MHDLDRTMQELEFEDEMEFEYEDEMEFEDEFEYESEYDDDDEYEYDDDDEFEYESEVSYGNPFSEEEEMELAAELLAVNSDEELDQFLGKIFRKVKRKVKKFARTGIGRKVMGGLKKIAKKALPVAGKVVGGFFGGPVGGAIGGKLGSFATRFFELELEGLSPEDQEFEVAKRFVRLAGASAVNAAKMPRTTPASTGAKKAIAQAARKYAPGYFKAGSIKTGKKSGRWIRKGNKIILLGV